jgi:hypothetical protein
MGVPEEVTMNDLHTEAWRISWPSGVDGLDNVKYHGTNAVADYRACVHPDATSREMVYRDEAEAAIREAERERDALRKDAERYRFLRNPEPFRTMDKGRMGVVLGNFEDDLDAAIDAAIAADGGGGG